MLSGSYRILPIARLYSYSFSHGTSKLGEKIALGSPVVPEVYMMVQKSSGPGGAGGRGAASPAAAKSAKAVTLMPSPLMACAPVAWSPP